MASPTPDPDTPVPLSPLEQFRAKTKRLSVHPAEKRVLWWVVAHLVFLSWALGGMPAWAQFVSLGFGIVGFTLALLPRNYTEEHTGSNRFRLIMWPKLLKFPVFWLGAALLGWIALQGVNPSWQYVTDGRGWWLQKIDAIAWLPTGVDAPFGRWNAWRMLLIHASGWLTVCTIWVAFTRRRTLQLLVFALSINGLLLGALGIAQQLLGNGKIFWLVDSVNAAFFASFFYKNHGSAYLLLTLAATCGLTGWYYLRGIRRLEKSNPAGVLAFLATCIAVAILTSFARGATLTMLVFLFGCMTALVWHQFKAPAESRRPVVTIVLVLIFGYFMKTGLEGLRTKEAWHRLQQGITRQDASLEMRERATAAATEMLAENWTRGTGAGSFRFVFPVYQHRHPDLVSQGGRRMFWEHAHNDVLQFPIELGLGGMIILAAGFGFFAVRLLKHYFWENPQSACLVFGAILVVVYSWWDFPFQNPAILITWAAMWPIAALWSQFEETGSRG